MCHTNEGFMVRSYFILRQTFTNIYAAVFSNVVLRHVEFRKCLWKKRTITMFDRNKRVDIVCYFVLLQCFIEISYTIISNLVPVKIEFLKWNYFVLCKAYKNMLSTIISNLVKHKIKPFKCLWKEGIVVFHTNDRVTLLCFKPLPKCTPPFSPILLE